MGDESKSRPSPPQQQMRRPSADEIREQQAIAAAMMIGEQSRREDRRQIYWVALRIGVFVAIMALLGLLILFAYSRIREDYNPTFWMLAIGALGAAGVTVAYWAHTEGRRE